MADAWSTPSASLVAAIVPNWRQPGPTLQVLQDLLACSHPNLRTILVDDGSGDDSAAQLADGCATIDGRAELVARATNGGYCVAMNAGLARARELGARYVLFLNNDVRLAPDFLAPLVRCLDKDPSLAGIGPTILDDDGKVWCQGGGIELKPNLAQLYGQGGDPAPTDHGPEAVGFLPGACALYRLDALDAVGGIDEAYWMYVEDVDLGTRLTAAGHTLLWLPWVRVVHEGSKSTGGGRSPLRKYASAVNEVRWLRRHGTWRHWLSFWWWDVLLAPLTFVSGTGAKAAQAKLRGTWDGLRGKPLSEVALRRYVTMD